MEKINLWESKLSNKFQFFTNIDEYIKFILDNNLEFSFTIKDKFTPGDTPNSILDNTALRDNLEIIYTDIDHPIAFTSNNTIDSYINSEFYHQHKDSLIKAATQILNKQISNKEFIININDFILTDELFEEIINNEEIKECHFSYQTIEGIPLSEEKIKRIQDKHLEFYIDNKKISTKYIIEYYTIDKLKKINDLLIEIPLKENIENFKYINESAIIRFIPVYNSIKDEPLFFNDIKNIINKLSSHQRSYTIQIDVENREHLRQSNLLNNLPSNITLTIKNDFYKYDLETYQKEEEKLEKLIKPIREANLSPLEKYIAVYNLVKQFKPYKENENNLEESRYLRYILDNEYIVCVGFANLLENLLNRVGINNKELSVYVDTSYDKGFTQEPIQIKKEGHSRNLIKLDDDKYNIHGYYIADATWDNSLKEDLYLNSLLTFDRKKEARRLEKLTDEDLLLDFHNFDEFITKINYFLRQEVKESYELEENEKLIDAYKSTYHKIMEILAKLDIEKYTYFHNKYSSKFNKMITELKDIESICNDLLTEYATYILPLSNNQIPISSILKAATQVKKEVDKLTNNEIKEWLQAVAKSNGTSEIKKFPYKYDPNNQTEAYLESRSKTK